MVALQRQVCTRRLDVLVIEQGSIPDGGMRGRPNGQVKRRHTSRPPLRGNERVLDGYFAELEKLSPLTIGEERELFQRYHDGDLSAKDGIINHNLRFVVRVAKQYIRSGMPLPDLISEGNTGLIHAVDKFEPDKNFKFISYAVWWIRQAILRAISTQSRIMKLPLNKSQEIYAIGKAIEELLQDNMHEPTVEEIAAKTGISPKSITNMLMVGCSPMPWGAKIHDTNITIGESVADGDPTALEVMESKSVSVNILEAIETLREKEKQTLMMYYGFDQEHRYTLEEIGSRMGVSRERIRQVRDRALKKVRQYIAQAPGGKESDDVPARKRKTGPKKA